MSRAADEEWFTADEVVTKYKLPSRDTLYGIRSRGRGPRAYKIAGELRFRASDLSAWEATLRVDGRAESA